MKTVQQNGRIGTQYEVEVAGLDEFVRLLELKAKEPSIAKQSLPRRAVCVAEMRDTRSGELGIACVKRYVRAGFVWGEDLITLILVSSRGYEHPDPAEVRKLEGKLAGLADAVREAIQGGLDDAGAADEFPLIRGFVRAATHVRDERG